MDGEEVWVAYRVSQLKTIVFCCCREVSLINDFLFLLMILIPFNDTILFHWGPQLQLVLSFHYHVSKDTSPCQSAPLFSRCLSKVTTSGPMYFPSPFLSLFQQLITLPHQASGMFSAFPHSAWPLSYLLGELELMSSGFHCHQNPVTLTSLMLNPCLALPLVWASELKFISPTYR